jgi:hypothetical protein
VDFYLADVQSRGIRVCRRLGLSPPARLSPTFIGIVGDPLTHPTPDRFCQEVLIGDRAVVDRRRSGRGQKSEGPVAAGPSCRAKRSTDVAPVARLPMVGQVFCVRSGGARQWSSSVRFVRVAAELSSSAFPAFAGGSIAPRPARAGRGASHAARPTGVTSKARRAAPITATVRPIIVLVTA